MRFVGFCLPLLGCLTALTVVQAADPVPELPPQQREFFETKIRPVLVQHCYECHSKDSERLRGGLRVDVRQGLRKGGESGEPAVAPGKVDEGTLLDALRHETYEMPPAGRLPDAVIDDFVAWIRMGAPDPRDGSVDIRKPHAIDLDAARQRWAFQPPQRTPIPALDSGWEDWMQTDVDRFIAARLQQAGLSPAPPADRLTLLRRLTYDLTGLPPTPERIRAFLEDDSQDAVEREVDRLLASREFAERWARHWLDVARFAESSGGGRSLMFPHAWRYRDYVIESFHQDKPYDRFLTEQIAGDLLPYDSQQQRDEQLTATGYLVLGAINYELQDKELLVMEVIDEQLEAVGRGFLGMTMACARCHDHKFDPISTRDYYALAGIFSSTKAITPGNVSGYVTRELGVSEELAAERRQHAERLSSAQKRLAAAEQELKRLRAAAPAAALDVEVDDKDATLTGQWKSSTHYKVFVGEGYIHDEFKGKGQCSATFEAALPGPGKYEVLVAYNPDSTRAPKTPVTVHHADGKSTVYLNQQQPPSEPPYRPVGVFEFEQQAKVVVANDGTEGFVVIVDGVGLRRVDREPAAKDPAEARREAKRAKQLQAAEQAAKAAKAEVAALRKSQPTGPPLAMGVDEGAPADGRVRIRGQVRELGEVVRRDNFLSVVQLPESESYRVGAEESGRLQLARWMTDPRHPLTSRVIVNRIWGRLMGEGIVATVDNFGAMGAEPTHPELLDFLALEFQQDGWSVKRLIRRLMLSRVYQLSSETTETQQRLDPKNRLLSHARRRRLDAEALRDSMLAASGLLEPCAGGRTIKRITAYDLGYKFGDVRQRSIYVPAFRNARLELFEVFDAPNPNLVVGRRPVSTLPTQALFMMNSPFVADAAQATAQRLLEIEADFAGRTEEAFLLLLNRPPRDSERKWAEQVMGDRQDDENAWKQLAQLLMASVDYRYLY